MKGFDLLHEIKAITRKRGINPQEYHQTLREANLKRWGNANVIRRDGIGIDEVYDEFKAEFPWVFESLDDFVEALADRLSKTQEEVDVDPEMIRLEEYYSSWDGVQEILFDLQLRSSRRRLEKEYTKKAIESIENEGLALKTNREITLTKKGIYTLLEMALKEVAR